MPRGGSLPSAGVHDPNRPEFLAAGVGAAAPGVLGWPGTAAAQSGDRSDKGQLTDLIHAANHQRFLIMASFEEPQSAAP